LPLGPWDPRFSQHHEEVPPRKAEEKVPNLPLLPQSAQGAEGPAVSLHCCQELMRPGVPDRLSPEARSEDVKACGVSGRWIRSPNCGSQGSASPRVPFPAASPRSSEGILRREALAAEANLQVVDTLRVENLYGTTLHRR
jgi:hypothetical protein